MATVNFSVPEEIKQAFNHTFANENKSAILAKLMKQAIEERKAKQQRAKAIDAILDLRSKQKPISASKIDQARQELRR